MATPLGHSIVGYTLARAAGVRHPGALGMAIATACLPDVDFLLGYVTQGDLLSLHHEVITHKPVFPLLVGGATGLAAAGAALLRGRTPRSRDVLRPAAIATGLVASHVAMDRLPVPYDVMPMRSASLWEVGVSQAWNAVVDMAFYGTLAALIFDRNGANGKRAEV
jgi:hypothetical protein